MLYGAIIGDIVGSRFEHINFKSKAFDLFHYSCHVTDDSIMTLAVADACVDIKEHHYTGLEIQRCFVSHLRKWGKKYPSAGYGSNFYEWLFATQPQPYNSWGNGSAMRVSAIGWMFDSLKEVEAMAELSASITHNNIEGINGAKAIAGAIYIARTTHSKRRVKSYIKSYKYKLKKLNCIRPTYRFDVSCQGTVPVAVEAFLESTDFEDTIRNAVSMGGDSDTLAAIAGSIAEAFYGVPDNLKLECNKYLNDDIRSFITERKF